jgi:4a-hydroxytetrahydrobiopterin dehydratase
MILLDQHCRRDALTLDAAALAELLAQLPHWRVEDGKLCRDFTLRDYYQTIAFVNALAWVAHQQDHHPELVVGYRHCAVRFCTDSAGATLTLNDLICAARVEALYRPQAGA